MNINQLKAFVSIVEKGTFSAAARAVGVSQPAVSLQIQALEEFLGVDLLDRRTKKVQLTEAGKLFYPTALQIVSQMDNAQHQLEELGESVKGRLSVGGSTIPGEYVLPKILGKFKKEYPEVSITLKIGDTNEITEMIISGELQIGLVGAKPNVAQLSAHPFLNDELVFIVPAGHEFAEKRMVTLNDLSQAEFILRERGLGTRQTIESHLAKQGLTLDDLNIVMELGSSEAVVNAVSSGLGVAITSKWAAERSLKLGEIVTVKLPGPPILRDLYLVTSKHAPARSTQAFMTCIEKLDVSQIKP
ncbi:selenium metabolism-associated LysR family transcriptional regulator [Candidatus Aquicultor secundus]|uniref:selenium metabolism-associated LysR family transcriptional regulator n=1 Tax=Candidatus Aquicultor secundus TaxID=1973895 RepID=UPI000CA85965|nr:selenium metabolism-associated LysR family transcriptional regulator [Candidatus Aquicultor secundus]PIU27372.1 MAG: LysR family transcriptional regulator [Candidatus Aquicultor secundus]